MENIIGDTQIPLGVAGPLKISTSDYLVPLATTEGLLVASVNRGCKATRQSGGVNVFTEKVGVTRGPVFVTKDLADSFKFKKWLLAHFSELAKHGEKTSSHLKLLKLETEIVGNRVFVRFSFDTLDAMGMNMATIATDKIATFIKVKTGVKCLSLSGNYCIDKKPSFLNFTRGRGFKVWADTYLNEKTLREVLKTTAQKFYDVWLSKCMIGSAMSGSMGFNAHFANTIAAFFAATGQDLAHVGECSMGITLAEIRGKNLYVSIYLPDLMVGTVGGGTGLTSQKKALSDLGLSGGNNGKNSETLAKIVGGAVLAGEISLISSLSEGSLAYVHQKRRNS